MIAPAPKPALPSACSRANTLERRGAVTEVASTAFMEGSIPAAPSPMRRLTSSACQAATARASAAVATPVSRTLAIRTRRAPTRSAMAPATGPAAKSPRASTPRQSPASDRLSPRPWLR